jgi:hypothetical protein
MKSQTIVDKHHPAGSANSRATLNVPVNDHRAVLSVAQRDWPRETLENREGCPLLAGAGRIRGFIDTSDYLTDKVLQKPELLESLSAFLLDRLGPQWWLDTPLERFARKDEDKCR